MKHSPLPEGYRWRVVPGVLKGTVKVKLQEKGWLFWHTTSDSLYGLFKGQDLSEEAILSIENRLWKNHKETNANVQWIKDNLK